jgi:hypothetical protein
MSYDLKFVIDMPYDRNEYANTSFLDTLVPPHFSNSRCDHHKEAHVKQSRHPNTPARAYYCCPYKSVSNNISHVWILYNLTLTSLFSYPNRIGVDSFSGMMNPRRSIHKFFSPYDRNESSLLRSFKHSVPPPPNPPPMTNEEKDEASTHHVRNPPTCKCGYRLIWWTCVTSWITHNFFVVWFLYR